MQTDECLFLAVCAAFHAGQAILEIYRTDFSVEYKSDLSPLTRADMDSNEIIKTYLSKGKSLFPIVSEEGQDIPFEERKTWPVVWIVDPLDGTKEFVKKNGEFAVNIALVENTIPILGVIYSPVQDLLFFSTEGNGAFRVEQAYALYSSATGSEKDKYSSLIMKKMKLPVYQYQLNTDTIVVATSRSHFSSETEAYLKGLKEKFRNVRVIHAGSSLKMCVVAEGKAQVYPRFGVTCEWDTAAGQAIIMASGGNVANYESGEVLVYNKPNLRNPWFVASANGCMMESIL